MSFPPFVTLDITKSQMLMDQLWNCGLRPTEGTGSAGALGATQKHLADLKEILYHQLQIKIKS